MWRWLLGFLTVVLGVLWAYTAWHTGEVERAHPPAGEFVEADGVRLHYVEAGRGPAVVLLHGAAANLNDWTASLFDETARRHRVIAFDRPGHGYSGRPDGNGHDPREQAALIHAALEELGVERPVIVGHSWSGALALAYALAYPQDVSGVLVLSGVTHPYEGGVEWYYGLSKAPVLGALFRHTLMAPVGEALLPPGVRGAFSPNPFPEDYVERAAARLLLRPKAFLNNARDMAHLNEGLQELSPQYGQISLPVIVMTGEEDAAVPPDNNARALHDDLPNSELILIPDVGHMPHYVRPLLVTDAIARLAREDGALPGGAAGGE